MQNQTNIDSGKENNNDNSKFEVGDHIRITKYKNIFAKVYTSTQSQEIFVIKKVKNIVPWTHI